MAAEGGKQGGGESGTIADECLRALELFFEAFEKGDDSTTGIDDEIASDINTTPFAEICEMVLNALPMLRQRHANRPGVLSILSQIEELILTAS